MALLACHLEQISLSTKSIGDLEFPPPKIFTNALLKDHEITTLIRDTEPHERALFSLDPNALSRTREQNAVQVASVDGPSHMRKSIFPSAHPVKQSAITRLLGNEMLSEIRRSSSNNARARDGVNVEVLLRGAEKLCEVYAVADAQEKIQALRDRHLEVSASVSALETKVSKQQSLLDRRNKGMGSDEVSNDDESQYEPAPNDETAIFTEKDFLLEEEEIRELEAKKKALEERVEGIQRDLGGLLR